MKNSRKKATEITREYAMDKLETHPFFLVRILNESRIRLLLKKAGDIDGKVIADIGCESGYVLFRLLKKGLPKKAYGVDISSYALDRARKTAKELNVSDKMVFINADAENVKLRDNTADITIHSNVLEHLKNPQKGFDEAVRITKKHGKIIFHLPNEKMLIGVKRFVKKCFPKLLGHLEIVTPGHIHVPDRKFINNLINSCPCPVRVVSLKKGPAISIIGLYWYLVLEKI
ncbi:MAG: class I SAM-dependent methyltransferase [Candidatus Woesearchaeota archaeon]